jgi:UDP-N-acetylmuramate--alanine ligase
MQPATGRDTAAVLMLGAGGTGMRNLAYLLMARGGQVTATDAALESLRKKPALRGATVINEDQAHDALRSAELIIYSTALPRQHPLLVLARRQDKPLLAYHEAVAKLAADFRVIAVAGTHGKSSTAAMLAHILVASERDPTVLLGADLPDWDGRGSRAGGSDLFIIEADEYQDHFLHLQPSAAIVTNIDFDHPDYFSSPREVARSFDRFLRRIKPAGVAVTLPDVRRRFAELAWPRQTELVADVSLSSPPRLPGKHMRRNAALAVAMAAQLDVPREQGAAILQTFGGLSRRTEAIGTYRGLTLISDYGHHPAAIAATYAALKEQYRQQRVVVLFEAHTLRRLTALGDDFLAALSRADAVLIVPVFIPGGRERETNEGKALVAQLESALKQQHIPVSVIASLSQLPRAVARLASSFDVAVAFTAGALDQHLRRLVKAS